MQKLYYVVLGVYKYHGSSTFDTCSSLIILPLIAKERSGHLDRIFIIKVIC